MTKKTSSDSVDAGAQMQSSYKEDTIDKAICATEMIHGGQIA
jgi:hypothetical protein